MVPLEGPQESTITGYCASVTASDWLGDTRTSYDAVAGSYADMFRDALAGEPFQRGILGLFAELVRAGGGGPVADIGCGPGRLTGHLRQLGLDTFGVDLSPAMIDIARRDHPGLRFEVGSMTDLDLTDSSVAGLLAWFSLIHIPDDEVPTVFGHFHRVLRPGGPLLVGFHVGDEDRLRTEGYGGHPMRVHVHRRPPHRVAGWLRDAGFLVEGELVHNADEYTQGAFLFARRRAGNRLAPPSAGRHDAASC
ncbi:class I SAM-dependent DNA methyltransferase [Plantactinospora sp. GCM10030261]|uniref:class I SAM-dependent DNA methyltransferase n=1 Tax=Plantactinospora sp. GCM10030261 TaxID=3273420 RepID=UPI00361C865F